MGKAQTICQERFATYDVLVNEGNAGPTMMQSECAMNTDVPDSSPEVWSGRFLTNQKKLAFLILGLPDLVWKNKIQPMTTKM